MIEKLRDRGEFEWKICVDTAPLLERSYAQLAGLGWIGRNTCLINQKLGSWIFLGEILTSLEFEPDAPPPDRCGTCRRCIEACPTEAIVPFGGEFTVDSRLCISYLTIELRGEIPGSKPRRYGLACLRLRHLSRRLPMESPCRDHRRRRFAPRNSVPELEKLAELSEEEFRTLFRGSPINRARYTGFLRNVVVAMGNSGNLELVAPLERLTLSRSDRSRARQMGASEA